MKNLKGIHFKYPLSTAKGFSTTSLLLMDDNEDEANNNSGNVSQTNDIKTFFSTMDSGTEEEKIEAMKSIEGLGLNSGFVPSLPET